MATPKQVLPKGLPLKSPLKKLSRQRRHQLDLKKRGLCIICGEPREVDGSAAYCKRHAEERRAKARAQSGCRPYRAGGPGRPPKGS